MWYWNPVTNNEAIPGIHNLACCTEIKDDAHPFKTEALDGGKVWVSDESGMPLCIASENFEENTEESAVTI